MQFCAARFGGFHCYGKNKADQDDDEGEDDKASDNAAEFVSKQP